MSSSVSVVVVEYRTLLNLRRDPVLVLLPLDASLLVLVFLPPDSSLLPSSALQYWEQIVPS